MTKLVHFAVVQVAPGIYCLRETSTAYLPGVLNSNTWIVRIKNLPGDMTIDQIGKVLAMFIDFSNLPYLLEWSNIESCLRYGYDAFRKVADAENYRPFTYGDPDYGTCIDYYVVLYKAPDTYYIEPAHWSPMRTGWVHKRDAWRIRLRSGSEIDSPAFVIRVTGIPRLKPNFQIAEALMLAVEEDPFDPPEEIPYRAIRSYLHAAIFDWDKLAYDWSDWSALVKVRPEIDDSYPC